MPMSPRLLRPRASAQPFLLDIASAAYAYSLRQLSRTYTGAVIRVRRSSDSAEQDFNPAEVSGSAMLGFVGAGDGHVVTWYDQSGNNRHVTAPSATAQPRVVISGTRRTIGTLTAIDFDGTNDGLKATTGLTNSHGIVASVTQADTSSGARTIWRLNGGIVISIHRFNGTLFNSLTQGSPGLNLNTTVTPTNRLLLVSQFGSAGAEQFVNSAAGSTGNGVLSTASPVGIGIGLEPNGNGENYDGRMQEVVAFDTSSPALRVFIEQNMNSYYAIY
jgi:hypothetical protein